MPEPGMPVRRTGDVHGRTFLEVTVSDEGDAYLTVRGQASDGEITPVQLEYRCIRGGGYHPKTLEALKGLALAMEQDNADSHSIDIYGEQH